MLLTKYTRVQNTFPLKYTLRSQVNLALICEEDWLFNFAITSAIVYLGGIVIIK